MSEEIGMGQKPPSKMDGTTGDPSTEFAAKEEKTVFNSFAMSNAFDLGKELALANECLHSIAYAKTTIHAEDACRAIKAHLRKAIQAADYMAASFYIRDST